jgi:hypothetical protein
VYISNHAPKHTTSNYNNHQDTKPTFNILFAAVALTGTTYGQIFTPLGNVSPNTGGQNIGIGVNSPAARLNIFSNNGTGLLLLLGYSTQRAVIQPPGENLPTTPIIPEYLLRMTCQIDPITGVAGYETPRTV